MDDGRHLKASIAEAQRVTIQLRSTLTCPNCGQRATETMPTDACQFFYDCNGCGTMLRPKSGDCCVFCSFGDVPCPPIQEAKHNNGAARCCVGS